MSRRVRCVREQVRERAAGGGRCGSEQLVARFTVRASNWPLHPTLVSQLETLDPTPYTLDSRP